MAEQPPIEEMIASLRELGNEFRVVAPSLSGGEEMVPVEITEFERAAELKLDYSLPYAQISDYYKFLGVRQKAKDALERSLSPAPDAPALRRRKTERNTGG